jgi:uncharacterized metal-binding protein YceD (DUF177 family)
MYQDIVIPIKGLPLGESSFRFEIGEPFFQAFENSLIKDADCSVRVRVVRHQTLLDIVCEIVGFVVVECDRCLEDLTLKVDIDPRLTVGFGTVDVDDASVEDDVQVIDHTESELNLNQFVYDYICLGLPLVKVHPEGKCNPEMLRYLTDNEGNETAADGEAARPFEGLKELLKNKNN